MIIKLGMDQFVLKLYKVYIKDDPVIPIYVKNLKNLLLQNQKPYDFETWHIASGTQALQSLYKWRPWVDLDLFYDNVKLDLLYIRMGKTVTKSFYGRKLAAKDYSDLKILLMKTK